jgi:IclR family pca regulon transcriptional regulator
MDEGTLPRAAPALPGAGAPAGTRRDFVPTLARGLEVLQAFAGAPERMTLSEVARRVQLPRATVRRSLLTLAALGFVESEGRQFRVTPRVLVLARSYLSSASLPRVAQPYLERLSEELGESCSVSVLHGEEVVYVARSSRKRLASLHREVGTHLPAYCTSMGRVLLAALPEPALDAWFDRARLIGLTPFTVYDPGALRARLVEVRFQGWSLVEQELEMDLLGLAVPLRNTQGHVVAAMNVSTQRSRMGAEAMTARFLPALQRVASEMRGLLG